VKCGGEAAILTIEWLEGDRCHARTLYRNYESGRGVAKDVKMAVHYYTKAAEQGNAYAAAKVQELSKP
jgi:hypothetical protein